MLRDREYLAHFFALNSGVERIDTRRIVLRTILADDYLLNVSFLGPLNGSRWQYQLANCLIYMRTFAGFSCSLLSFRQSVRLQSC